MLYYSDIHVCNKKYQTFLNKCLNRVMAFTANGKFLPKERTIKICQSFWMTSKFVGLFTANV